jgi:hypothetical protein
MHWLRSPTSIRSNKYHRIYEMVNTVMNRRTWPWPTSGWRTVRSTGSAGLKPSIQVIENWISSHRYAQCTNTVVAAFGVECVLRTYLLLNRLLLILCIISWNLITLGLRVRLSMKSHDCVLILKKLQFFS